jgi:Phage integrase family
VARKSCTPRQSPEHTRTTTSSSCENGTFDPTRPQKSRRSAWRSLRKAAAIPALRFHDLRHHAITELAESQASDATIMAMFGRVSRQMLEHCSHVRMGLKRKALDGLATHGPISECKPISYDTKSPIGGDQGRRRLQTRMVGERGFEPPTPWSRTRCSTRLSHSPNLRLEGCLRAERSLAEPLMNARKL